MENSLAQLDRRMGQDHLNLDLSAGAHTLDILVENSGRINFGPKLREDRKGITESVSLGDSTLVGWKVFCLPMSDLHAVSFSNKAAGGPAFYRGFFQLEQMGDTFLDMRSFGKGAVWVNGHALGRFWHVGPQRTLYLPGAWLKKGRNEVIVFDLAAHTEPPKLSGLSHSILDMLSEAAPANPR